MRRRTELERDANRLDLDLFRILSRVKSLGGDHRTAGEPMSRAVELLNRARQHIRGLMHDEDRRETS
jgi:hypothetical protein